LPDEIGVAVVGTGYAAEYLHLPQLVKIPNLRVNAIVSRSMDRGKLLAKRFGIEACHVELDQALKRDDVQLVDICLPTFLHKQYVIRAAEAGKHILCEKPMAVTLREADEIIEAVRRMRTKLMIAHVLRFAPEYLKVKELADGDYLGEVVAARALRIPGGSYPWEGMSREARAIPHWKAYAAKGGGILDLQIHDIDYLRFLFKAHVETVCAFGGRLAGKTVDAFDHSFAIIRLDDGRVWDVTSSWIRPIDSPFIQNLELYGSERHLVLDNLMSPPLTLYGKEGSISRIEPGEGNAVFTEIQHFVNCITRKEDPSITPEDARASLEVSLAVAKSILTMKPVTLPLME
jgi:predicted dehydrogenase